MRLRGHRAGGGAGAPSRHLALIKDPWEHDNLSHLLTNHSRGGNENQVCGTYDSEHGGALFKHSHEANTIQLFFDLFFIANLTTFTNIHETNDRRNLTSYVGFFALLWFTWLQVALFDVRFGFDSVFERVCKAMHFGVMVGFAIIATGFVPELDGDGYYIPDFRGLSIILMASRLILVVQYSAIAWFVKAHRQTWVPMLLTIATLSLSAIVYLGVFSAFRLDRQTNAYVIWYIAAVLEALVLLSISSFWRFLSFKGTPLVERLGLLTLIILGEGVIGMTKAINKIAAGFGWTSSSIGQIISAILILYSLWMLYFDQIEVNRMGTIRQQFWALLHFPLHVALVLTLEGVSQFIGWWSAFEGFISIETYLGQAVAFVNNTVTSPNAIFSALDNVYAHFPGTNHANLTQIGQYANIVANGTSGQNTTAEALQNITEILQVNYFNYYGIQGAKNTGSSDPFDGLESIFEFFALVYYYFFSAAAATMIMLAILVLTGKRGQTLHEWQAIIVRISVGVGLALLLLLPLNETAVIRYVLSPWILPTVLISFGLVLVCDNVFLCLIPPRFLENKGPYAAPIVNDEMYQLMEVGKGNGNHATMQTYPVRGP